MIHTGDCVEVMAQMDPDSIDAIVTDPPYGLEFMGKEWDRLAPEKPSRLRSGWTEAGVAHGIDRAPADTKYGKGVKYHNRRGTWYCPKCDKRDAFRNEHACGEVEWRHEWVDKKPLEALAMQQWHQRWATEALRVAKPGAYLLAFGGTRTVHRLTVALEDAGWIIRDLLVWAYASGFPKSKASLKPAWEPIVLARKPGPLRELAIDACRIGTEGGGGNGLGSSFGNETVPMVKHGEDKTGSMGRWPANVVLTDPVFDGDYSRFFLIPKASRRDREPEVPGKLEQTSERDGSRVRNARCRKCKRVQFAAGESRCRCEIPEWGPSSRRYNTHPTVKPSRLMRHLVRLVTPEGGTVLDPFLGSGTTAIAAEAEGFEWVGIEREPEYVTIAEQRLVGVESGLGL